MYWKLLKLEWKSFLRSATMGKELGIKILIGFFALYGLISVLILGVGLYFILDELNTGKQPIHIVNQFIVLWFVYELMIRYMMQKIPIINIKPFLIQNIRRKTLVNFILIKSIFSVFNFFSPLMIIPFAMVNLFQSDFSLVQISGWTLTMLSLVFIANFLNIYIEKKIVDNNSLLISFLGIIALLFGLEYFEIFYTTKFIGNLFDLILLQPYWAIIPITLLVVLYKLNEKNLSQNFYLDAYLKTQSDKFDDTDLSWTRKFGNVAPFMQLDMKLIWRNKRPKTTIYMSLFFALYGLIFYTQETYNESGMWVFTGLFMTGIFMINFGQFIPAWDSSYYQMMMTQNIPMKLYLKSKITLMSFSIIVMSILILPYGFFDTKIIFLNLACAIYNLGINIPIILAAGSYNKKRIDLDKSQFSNYQGTGITQWLIIIPLVILPIIIWYIFKLFSDFYVASILIGVLGVIGLLCRNLIFGKILHLYKTKKYQAIQGFKQQNA